MIFTRDLLVESFTADHEAARPLNKFIVLIGLPMPLASLGTMQSTDRFGRQGPEVLLQEHLKEAGVSA